MQKLKAYMFCFALNLSVVALYLHQEWRCVEDVLQTSSNTRSGLLPVKYATVHQIVYVSLTLKLDKFNKFNVNFEETTV